MYRFPQDELAKINEQTVQKISIKPPVFSLLRKFLKMADIIIKDKYFLKTCSACLLIKSV